MTDLFRVVNAPLAARAGQLRRMLAVAIFMLLGLPFQVIEADALFLRTKKGTL